MKSPALIVTLVAACGAALAQPSQQRSQTLTASPALEVASQSKAMPRGEALLSALLSEYDRNPSDTLARRIDSVAGQRDAVWSRLYWHRDLDSAKSAAAAEGKPILYLRLLGQLTDEYSCANSRFFRTVLYANPDVADLLRERFVLVWESERPVPVVTIDFGDGRVMKRTLTGNSIHYVLTPEGEVVDALPGLYDPVTFAGVLSDAANAALDTGDTARRAHLASSLTRLLASEQRERAMLAGGVVEPTAGSADWQAETANAAPADVAVKNSMTKRAVEAPIVEAISPAAAEASRVTFTKDRVESPIITEVVAEPAERAMPLTTSKFLVETPLLSSFRVAAPPPAEIPPAAVIAADRAVAKRKVESPIVGAVAAEPAAADRWSAIAALHMADARPHVSSIDLMISQNPALAADPALLERTVNNFQRSIARDTVRNEYEFRTTILRWMLEADAPIGLAELNRRVYGELFLTPRSDPWLGLAPDATYSALPSDGCSVPSAQ